MTMPKHAVPAATAPERIAQAAVPPLSPLAIAQVAVRNLVPVAGILFFGWHAFNVLALYFVDTLLQIAVLAAGASRSLSRPGDKSNAGRPPSELAYMGAGLLVAAIMAMPLGVPLTFMANGNGSSMQATFTEHSFYMGIGIQTLMALFSYLTLRRMIDAGHSANELGLKRRFALVFLRWIVVLGVVYTGLGPLLGHYAPAFFVFIYAAVSIVTEIAPDRFLRMMPKGGGRPI